MSQSPSTQFTRLLAEVARGERDPADVMLPRVYEELRKLARFHMAKERSDHTLDATGLVHEAYLRLIGGMEPAWSDRAHFYAAAAEAMRRILIEHARKRGRVKRGGGRAREALNLLDLASSNLSEDILALDEAIRRLREEDSRCASVVELRFFAGLSVSETAQALSLSPRTVMREWSFARAWLFEKLSPGEESCGQDG